MKPACVFCEIVAGRLAAHIVCENDHMLAIAPKQPEAEGHTVIIPKSHAKNLLEIGVEDLRRLMDFIKNLTHHLMEGEDCTGVNLLHASGTSAQQSVDHFHIHLFPRSADDGLNLWPNLPGVGNALEPFELVPPLKKDRD